MGQKKLKVNEIFLSIQCEGFHAGLPVVFVRTSGCNLACSWCDSKYANKKGEWLSFSQVFKEIKKYPTRSVVLTGSEPTIQRHFIGFCRMLLIEGYKVHIETNGTIKLPHDIATMCWITVSPKCKANELVQNYGSELKVVYAGQSDKCLSDYEKLAFDYFYLQPCSLKNADTVYKKVLERGYKWRMSNQVHKLIHVR